MSIFARFGSENCLKRLFGQLLVSEPLAFHELLSDVVEAVLVGLFSLDLILQHLLRLHIGDSHRAGETLLVAPPGRLLLPEFMIHHGLGIERLKVDLYLTYGVLDARNVIFCWAYAHKSRLLFFVASS